ncbi:MAG: acyl-CoA dehydratase activase-related protein [Bacillota bacterium]|nr:acyl-CoA dehydratase activase-related protein [Bacillota bacterium]
MRLGIARGFFYYDYMLFLKTLFQGTSIETVMGGENNEEILERGSRLTVDEACLPIKLFTGQLEALCETCDRVFVPRLMKDFRGRWLCPKLLGVPELSLGVPKAGKLLVTDPLYFNNEGRTRRSLWKACRQMEIKRGKFEENFTRAYAAQKKVATGSKYAHVEAAWEFSPETPADGEIVLPNTRRIFLAGHCYNVYDKFSNGQIMKKLDELGIEAVTEREVTQTERELAVEGVNLIKEPFWESFIRIFGSALHLRDEVDGIIYLSSFSCGPDAFIIEMLKNYVRNIPIMVLKLDEHKGEAGYETRIEAFADLLEKRKAS